MLQDRLRGQPSGRRLGRGDIGQWLPSHQPLDPPEEREQDLGPGLTINLLGMIAALVSSRDFMRQPVRTNAEY